MSFWLTCVPFLNRICLIGAEIFARNLCLKEGCVGRVFTWSTCHLCGCSRTWRRMRARARARARGTRTCCNSPVTECRQNSESPRFQHENFARATPNRTDTDRQEPTFWHHNFNLRVKDSSSVISIQLSHLAGTTWSLSLLVKIIR